MYLCFFINSLATNGTARCALKVRSTEQFVVCLFFE